MLLAIMLTGDLESSQPRSRSVEAAFRLSARTLP